jgi:putative secretion ATPase (PEP-CTERM system associated)
MYESYYQFREKPFSLLPDAGFLFLSKQHRMALTLLDYGLMNQAGFTVISGDIGTGKTTLIRRVLSQIDPQITVGLISNTHQTFGDLMQWIALAFDLPRQGRDKVQLYHDFMDFIIQEYAHGRRTVLIVDEAQNMSTEALEELRMLSNVNADKDQVLQIILIGQRELRETLQRPDLVQFAQRIGVDYHLEPLSEEETRQYIQHRCSTAGGNPELFSDQACHAVYAHTGGIPRLINLLCDTALVYGYAEQLEHIDAKLVDDAARDKQQGGLFSQRAATPPAPQPETAVADVTITRPEPATDSGGSGGSPLHAEPQEEAARTPAGGPENIGARRKSAPAAVKTGHSGNLRVAIASESELLRTYLAKLLGRFHIQVVRMMPLRAGELRACNEQSVDVLLVELDDHLDHLDEEVYELLEKWDKPVLFNDSLATEASLSQPNRLDYGRKLSQKLYSLVPRAPQSVA